MAVTDQLITDRYAIYNGDCIEVMAALPSDSIHLSVYSPPFAGLYHYSSDDRDLSNTRVTRRSLSTTTTWWPSLPGSPCRAA